MVTAQEQLAVAKRRQLKIVAKQRGRGFTRTEAQRFLGGAVGVSRLRSARAKGVTAEQERVPVPDVLVTPSGEPVATAIPRVSTIAEQLQSQAPQPLTPPEGLKEKVKKGLALTFGLREFETEELQSISGRGATLQSALFLSLAGVRVPKGILKVPLRQVREPSFIEIQQPIIVSGKPSVLSKFEITTELQPPSLVAREGEGLLFGRVQPAKVERIISLPSLEKQPIVTVTTRGGRTGKIDILTGTSRKAGVEELGTLPPRQEFLFQRRAELRTGGRPVSKEVVPKILKGREFDLGEIRQFRLGKADIGFKPTKLDLFPPKQVGKRTQRFETLSEFRKVKEAEKFDIFKGDIIFKDITFPGARATGKTPRLKGTIFRIREPLIFGDDLGLSLTKKVGGRKTKLSTTFQEQITIPLQITPKPIPKAKSPKVALKKEKTTRVGGISGVSLRLPSRDIGGSIDFDSRFVSDLLSGRGKALQPFQDVVSAKRPKDPFEVGKVQSRLGTSFAPKINIAFASKLKDTGRLRVETKTRQKEISALKFDTKSIQQEKLVQQTKQTQRQKQTSKALSIFKFQRPVRRPTGKRFTKREAQKPVVKVPKFLIPRLSFNERGKGIGDVGLGRGFIRASFTSIVTGFEKPAKFIKGLGGTSPFSLRGLKTQIDFALPKRKIKKKSKKKS